MTPAELINSIYLGDRSCKAIIVDGWAAEVKLQVDCISRVRGPQWNYYRAEDMPNGSIVFEGVRRIEWDPNGKVPNDAITGLAVAPCESGEAKFTFVVEIASGDVSTLISTPVRIRLYADAIALETQEGGVRIRE